MPSNDKENSSQLDSPGEKNKISHNKASEPVSKGSNGSSTTF